MKVLTGHLTATEKKVVKQIIQNSWNYGKVGLKTYFVEKNNDVFNVKIQIVDRGLIPCPGSKLRLSTYLSIIKL